MPVDITLKTIAKAKADARNGRINITDSRARGLVLRGGPADLTWQHRRELGGKTERLIIGAVDRWSIAEARTIADAASDHILTFKTPVNEDWLSAHLVAAGKIDAPAGRGHGSISFPTYAEAREEYLKAVAGHLSQGSISSYRDSLEHKKVCTALDHRRLPTITRDDIMEIVFDVHSEHQRSAELIISAIRPMWNFLAEDGRRKRYGVEPGLMIPLKNPARRIVIDNDEDDDMQPWSQGYVPEISELGRIIAVARSGIMTPTTGAAVELACWTVQRRRTISTARLRDFVELPDGNSGLWRVPPQSLKGGKSKKRPHTIPLPPPVWDCVKRAAIAAIEQNPETKYLFPGARPRRKGMAVTHMSPSTLGHRFADVPGCGATCHDVRRTMGTHGEQLLGFARVDTGYLMDHEESVRQSDRITSRTKGTGTHDVTGAHYSLHDGTHHSWPVMQAWAGALDRAVAEAMEALDRRQLAREYGDKLYRIGAKPWGWIVATTPEEVAASLARDKAIKSKVKSLGLLKEGEP